MKPGFLILLLAALMSGCISEKRCAERYPSAERSDVFVQHDTVTCVKDSLIPLPADSGLIKALLECQDGKVVVKEILEVKPGKRVVPFFSVQNNVLTTVQRSTAAQSTLHGKKLISGNPGLNPGQLKSQCIKSPVSKTS